MASNEEDIVRVIEQLRNGSRVSVGSNESVTLAVFRLRQSVSEKKDHAASTAGALRRALDSYEQERDALVRGTALVVERLTAQDLATQSKSEEIQVVAEAVRRRGMDLGVIKE